MPMQSKVESEKLIIPTRAKRAVSLGLEGLAVTLLGAEQRPDEAAEFTGDGDLGFVALQAAGQQPSKAQVQPVLRLPTQSPDRFGLSFLAAGELFADFGRQSVMLGALSED